MFSQREVLTNVGGGRITDDLIGDEQNGSRTNSTDMRQQLGVLNENSTFVLCPVERPSVYPYVGTTLLDGITAKNLA